jgi:hypothetical protein|mmetsp:Transcript_11144/g.23624  ORF Transcript_11144/g.23624 Transcript_11144/m.23624 type:complete len:168 (-) Transcript_11144:386-889(-)
MIQRNDFATKALKMMEAGRFDKKTTTTIVNGSASSMLSNSTSSTKRSGLMKRSRSSRSVVSGSFDMGDFLKASQQVEDTIAFPAIEWPSFDDDDDSSSDDDNSYSFASPLTRKREGREEDEEEEDNFGYQSQRKRQCRGLTRCDRSCNLSSLWEVPTERRGSNGSLS